MSGYHSLYASHVQKQLLSNEADIICPPVLELFIRCLTSAVYHLIPSELICWVMKPAHFKFLEYGYIFLNPHPHSSSDFRALHWAKQQTRSTYHPQNEN